MNIKRVILQLILSIFLIFEGYIVLLNGVMTSLPWEAFNYLWTWAGIGFIVLGFLIWLVTWQRLLPLVMTIIDLILVICQMRLADTVDWSNLRLEILGLILVVILIWRTPKGTKLLR